LHGKEPAYETGGGLSASCYLKKWWRPAVARRALVVFSHAPSLDRPDLRERVGTSGRSRTHPLGFGDRAVPWNYGRVKWCPRPVARRLPLFGRQPCICEHLSGETGGAGRLRSVSSALRARRATVITTAPVGHDGGTCTRDPQLCRLVPSLLGHVVLENYSAAQVTRRRKTSPAAVLSDRGLGFGGAGGSRTRTGRIKSPLCYC
jgi:hypothetical protein